MRDLVCNIEKLASQFTALNRMAYDCYKPIADDYCSRTVSENELESVFDYMVPLCGEDKMLELFKNMCRHYIDIYPESIVFYVKLYREMFGDSDEL